LSPAERRYDDAEEDKSDNKSHLLKASVKMFEEPESSLDAANIAGVGN